MDRERALEEQLDEIERLVRTLVVRVTDSSSTVPHPLSLRRGHGCPRCRRGRLRPLRRRPPEPVAGPESPDQTTRGRAQTESAQAREVVRRPARGPDPRVARRVRNRHRSRLLPRHRRRPWLDRRRGARGARLPRLDDPSRGQPLFLRAARTDRSGGRRRRERTGRALRVSDVRDRGAGGHRPGSGAPRRRPRGRGRRGDRGALEIAVRRRARLAGRACGTRPRRWRYDGVVPRLHGRRARRDGWSPPVATLGLAGAGCLPDQRAPARVLVVGSRRPPPAARHPGALLVSLRGRRNRCRASRAGFSFAPSRPHRCSC